MLAGNPCPPLLDVVEFGTPDPGERLALYQSLGNLEVMNPKDLALLKRRAAVEGFAV